MKTLNTTVRAKLAKARALVGKLPETETAAGSYVVGSRDWTYAPGHVIHEEAQAALRLVNLELDSRQWKIVEVAGAPVLEVTLQLVIVAGDGAGEFEEWTAQMLLGSITSPIAVASALGWLLRHQRLSLLDFPTVPAEEEDNNRAKAAATVWDRRRESLPAPRRRGVPEDDGPSWANLDDEVRAVEEDIAAKDAERAKAEAMETFVKVSKNRLGCPSVLDLAYEVSGQTGKDKDPLRVTAKEWCEVTRRLLAWKEAG